MDVEETLRALDDLVHQGKVRYIGSSTFPASQIIEAQWTARQYGLNRFVCEQPPYSILVRGVEADVLPACQRHGMGVIPWSPLASGWLSGKWRKGAVPPSSSRSGFFPQLFDLSRPANQRKLEAADALGALADQAGISLVELAVAFVIRHPAVTSAIIGRRTMEQLESQLGASEVKLEESLLNRIDEIAPPGANLDANEPGLDNPALAPAARRR
jgi:aryl-alcohol dehydrogenase-like predicted oxidoreductase